MKDNKFKCAACGQVFEREWSDEEAQKEYKENFGDFNDGLGTEIVCDDCYKKMMAEYPPSDFLKDEEFKILLKEEIERLDKENRETFNKLFEGREGVYYKDIYIHDYDSFMEAYNKVFTDVLMADVENFADVKDIPYGDRYEFAGE